jgi:hypothetical protein
LVDTEEENVKKTLRQQTLKLKRPVERDLQNIRGKDMDWTNLVQERGSGGLLWTRQ